MVNRTFGEVEGSEEEEEDGDDGEAEGERAREELLVLTTLTEFEEIDSEEYLTLSLSFAES